jgi:fumarylacetoacetase
MPDHHDEPPVVGVGIGDLVLDLALLHDEGFFENTPVAEDNVFDFHCLNELLRYGHDAWTAVRATISDLLREDGTEAAKLRDHENLSKRAFVPIADVTLHMPVEIGDYTDFYASREHASNVGSMFRDPSNPLLPNWKHIPVGYHGRASSVILTGRDVIRPCGQTKADDAEMPTFGPSRLLDFELEMGFITGEANKLGEPVSVEDAHRHIFGLVLVNDWSARDIQKWEYVPLGPFLSKNFSTQISAWVVPLEAVEPFRVRTPRQDDDPAAQPYLDGAWDWGAGPVAGGVHRVGEDAGGGHRADAGLREQLQADVLEHLPAADASDGERVQCPGG